MSVSRREFQFLLAGSCLVRAQNRRVVPGEDKPATTPPKPVATSGEGRRVALLLGNNAYTRAPRLANAVNDVTGLNTALEGYEFQTTRLTDFSLTRGQDAINKFAASLGSGDVALLYYSGHGVQIGGENYMVPADFDPAHGETRVKAECISISEAQAKIEKSGVRMNMIIIDACRDNPFRQSAKVRGLALMEAGLGTCIALAAGPGQTASDNPNERNGLFTKYLLKELGGPATPIEQLFKQVKEQVYAASAQKQRPWLLFDTIGEFTFAKAGKAGAQAGGQAAIPRSNEFERLLEQGRQQYQAGQFEAARQTFERAIQINPEDAYAYNAVGAAYMRTGKASLAVGLFAKAIELKADYAAAYFNRGVAYYNAGRYELAAQDFSWAIDQEPFDPRAYDLRGQAYLVLRDHNDEALADFNRALELNPSDATAFLGRGRLSFRTGKNAEAIQDLTSAIEIRPTWEAYDVRSQAYRAMGRTAQYNADHAEAERLRGR